MSKPTVERRTSARLARKESAAPYSRSASKGDGVGSTGLTSYMADSKLGFDEDKVDATPQRSFSLFGGGKGKKKEPKVTLPANWKKAKEKNGTIYYFNTITQQRSHEPPPPLPRGWKEALHKAGRDTCDLALLHT